MKGVCIQCGSGFNNRSGKPKDRGDQRFCSRECAAGYGKKNRPTCPKCGRRHKGTPGEPCTKCSVKESHHAERTATCSFCHKIFATNNLRIKYCSDECRANQSARAKTEWRSGNLKEAMGEKLEAGPYTCKWCGIAFYAKYGTKKRKYCGDNCAKAARNNRVAFYARIRHQKTRVLCANGTYRDPISLRRLYLRDGGVCQICFKKVEWGLKTNGAGGNDHLSATRDHIIPIACGGDHTWENVRLAHFICNCNRGTGGTAQLLLFG